MKDHLPIAVKRNGNAAWGTTSQSSLRDASSPGRGATGESVVVVLDEQSFLQSGTTGLRCLDSRLLAQTESFFHKFSKKTCKI